MIAPRILALGGLALTLAGFGAGWTTNGWRLTSAHNAERLEAARATLAATESAHRVYQDDIARAAAAAATRERSTQILAGKIDQARQEYRRHAQANPLSADCVLDAGRLRKLDTAREAANAAIAGSAGS